jgi:hypothetical protein
MKNTAQLDAMPLLFLLSASLACNSQALQTNGHTWKVMSGQPDGEHVAKVCLTRKDSEGWFSPQEWVTHLGFEGRTCDERLIADLDDRAFFFAFDEDTPRYTPRGHLAGTASVYCWRGYPEDKYSPCTSVFFAPPEPVARNYRVLTTRFDKVIEQAETLDLLEKIILEHEAQDQREKYPSYLDAYRSAKTLEDIIRFQALYQSYDPDRLVAQLQEKKETLKRQQYFARFSAADSITELNKFISAYKFDDPEALVPKAQQRRNLLMEEARKQEERADKAEELAELERAVRWCDVQITEANKTLERERRITTVSGVKNLDILRSAGELIVFCQDRIKSDFAKYTTSGGRKTLDELRSSERR